MCVILHTDSYGGTLAGEDEASYLFSDDATAKDTIRYVARYILYLVCLQTQHQIAVGYFWYLTEY